MDDEFAAPAAKPPAPVGLDVEGPGLSGSMIRTSRVVPQGGGGLVGWLGGLVGLVTWGLLKTVFS